jgi:hypothetical protein
MRLTEDAASLVCEYIENGVIVSESRLDLLIGHATCLTRKLGDPIISGKVMAAAIRDCFSRGLFDHREG